MPHRSERSLRRPKESTFRPLPYYLALMQKRGASDLHLLVRRPPLLRVHGELIELEGPPLTAAMVESLIGSALTAEQRARFVAELDLDFAFEPSGLGARFRVNVFLEVHGWGANFRLIPAELPSLKELKLPPVLARIAGLRSGLVLVSGPTGSGKSTTLASLVAQINDTREAHILTIEDPIEYVHPSRRSLVAQREVRSHTASFATALRMATREDPDVIVVGELRDLETFRLTLQAAELGILVFATLHANSASRAVDRIVDVFSADEQPQVRAMLADSLRAVVAQQLLPTAGPRGRVLVCEVLLGTSGVSNLIREAKTSLIHSAMQTGTSLGMQTMDGAILDLWKAGRITRETAEQAVTDPELFLRSALASSRGHAVVPARRGSTS